MINYETYNEIKRHIIFPPKIGTSVFLFFLFFVFYYFSSPAPISFPEVHIILLQKHKPRETKMGNDDDDSYGPHDNELEDDDDEEEKGENILNEIGSPSSSKKSSGTTGTGLDSIQFTMIRYRCTSIRKESNDGDVYGVTKHFFGIQQKRWLI